MRYRCTIEIDMDGDTPNDAATEFLRFLLTSAPLTYWYVDVKEHASNETTTVVVHVAPLLK